MIEHVINTGDTGRLKIEDYTDDPNKMSVELWVQSLSPKSIPQLPWAYSLDANRTSWRSFNFKDTTMWQRLGSVYLGASVKAFTLHLGSTGTSQLGGPTDHTIDPAGYVAPVAPSPTPGVAGEINIKVGNVWKRATPYVRVNGVWKVVETHIRTERGWAKLG